MNPEAVPVLIVARSVPLADGLAALFKAMPQIDDVEIAASIEQALRRIETRHQTVVVIDSALLGSRPEALLDTIHLLSPRTQRLLLVDDVHLTYLIPSHAEAILVKGVAPAEVAGIVTHLLQNKEL